MERLSYLRKKAASLPETPGVYIMKNEGGAVIYVGKSKRLKMRVSSYFLQNHKHPKTARLVSQIYDFDFFLCKTEMEALTLENVLIKKHLPKYNIRLKDSKSYPYIKVTSGDYPMIFVTRERKSDGSKYFGPYQSAGSAYDALEVIKRIFTLPTCKRSFPRDIGKERPCIYRDMGRCIAPCSGGVAVESYRELIRGAEKVLGGNIQRTVAELTERMNEASEALEFERAIDLRDKINALMRLREKQHVVSDARVSRDAFSIYTEGSVGVMATLTVREGAVVRKHELILTGGELIGSDEAVSLIADYYDGIEDLPREVLVDLELDTDDEALLSEYLSLIAGRRVAVRRGERGEGRALLELCKKNAIEAERQYLLDGEREDKNLARLASLLSLPHPPERIEAYDISNIGDEHITASMVVYSGGKMKKSDYRLFKMETVDKRDDYASMREAITRRISHIGGEDGSLGSVPDLILLDGGDTHVGAVLPIIKEAELDIPVFGMVKDDFHKTRAITDGVREISIAQELGVYSLVYRIQEEAHRFAYTASQKAKTKSLTRSTLQEIEGVGPARARAILKRYKLSELPTLTAEMLCEVQGISKTTAEAIVKYFRDKNPI
ncbi:MAG: excinuclease ABC subunit UvrC [Clostridia bacterium]|nr:excinuclease ABC subunit UvrC [Clostridia bacterium]